MNIKNLKSICLLIGIALIFGVFLTKISERSRSIQKDERAFLKLNKNTGPIIRGFQFSKYHQGRKTLNIKAAKFSLEKKKIGLFKLAPFKVARFRDAEIDFYGKTDPPDEKKSLPRNPFSDEDSHAVFRNDISFKGILSDEILPPVMMKGSVSAICEPVRINLFLNDTPVTRIQAQKAIVDPRRRIMILREKIQVTSGAFNLSTDQLAIYPEKGVLEVENTYVLKGRNETTTGEKLTTDFFLQKSSIQ